MLEPRVIYEDKNFLAVDKPAGLLVHEARSVRHDTQKNASRFVLHARGNFTLVHWLLTRYPEIRDVGDDPRMRPGIVHRLDRETSGILLVARNQKYFTYLKSLFQKHAVQKLYLAFVLGNVKEREGEIRKPIGIKTGTVKRSVHSEKFLKEAVTRYRVLRHLPGTTLLHVEPETGRTHQIRVHLASIGHPIIGDTLYGKSKSRDGKPRATRLMLHALSLEFATKEGTRMHIEAAPPEEFARYLNSSP